MKNKFKNISLVLCILLALTSCSGDTNNVPVDKEKPVIEESVEETIPSEEEIISSEEPQSEAVDSIEVEPEQTSNTFEEARVVRIVDGDTIVIDRGNGDEKVRFILVNTPETKHPQKGVEYFGKEASAYTRQALDGKTIYLQKDVSETDKYNRLLRYIWLERPESDDPTDEEIKDKCFNAYLLAQGFANVSTFPPDIRYVDLFRELEAEARDNNKGLWNETEANNFYKAQDTTNNQVEQNNTGQTNEKPKTNDPASLYANGKIIGNKNSHFYHLPTGANYDKTYYKNAVFFDTEEEAQAAGYRKAKR